MKTQRNQKYFFLILKVWPKIKKKEKDIQMANKYMKSAYENNIITY